MKGHAEDCHCGHCATVIEELAVALQEIDEPAAPPSKTFRVATFHGEDQQRVAVVGEPGRKWIFAVVFDTPIRMLKLPLEEQRNLRDVQPPYPAAKAAKKMLAAAKRLGITEGARAFLKGVLGES